MKFDAQVRVLQTFARLSGHSKRVIEPKPLSQAMNNEVSHYTVPLNNGFFVDCGWLEKRGRGEYAATDVLVAYSRRVDVEGHSEKAAEILRGSARKSWFWMAIEPQLGPAGAPLSEVMVTLMTEAGVGAEHTPQLLNILEWLRHIGMVRVSNERVFALESGTPETKAESNDGKNADVEVKATPPAHREVFTVPDIPLPPDLTPQGGRASSGAILAFDFTLRLTAEDLAALSAEQITAVFGAVGTIMAAKKSAEG
jgi:hypothetical protein